MGAGTFSKSRKRASPHFFSNDAARTSEVNPAFPQGLLRQTAELGFLTVRFTGSEPLL